MTRMTKKNETLFDLKFTDVTGGKIYALRNALKHWSSPVSQDILVPLEQEMRKLGLCRRLLPDGIAFYSL